MHLSVVLYLLSFLRTCLATGWIIPVYDVRSHERFGFAEDFLRHVLLEQSTEVGGPYLEYAITPLDREGYIINEEGQLVPFRIYKKGNNGARLMCFLHPRNCRGGFHKRLIDVPSEQPAENVYNVGVIKRSGQASRRQKEQNIPMPVLNSKLQGTFDMGFNSEEGGTEVTSYVPEELKMLKEYNRLLLEHPELISLKSEPEQLEHYSDYDNGLLSLPIKPSRNSNDISGDFGLRTDFNVDDSDFKYLENWPLYSSDSSLAVEYPKQIDSRQPYSFIPGNLDGLSKTGSRQFLSGYDVTAYRPYKERRQR